MAILSELKMGMVRVLLLIKYKGKNESILSSDGTIIGVTEWKQVGRLLCFLIGNGGWITGAS